MFWRWLKQGSQKQTQIAAEPNPAGNRALPAQMAIYLQSLLAGEQAHPETTLAQLPGATASIMSHHLAPQNGFADIHPALDGNWLLYLDCGFDVLAIKFSEEAFTSWWQTQRGMRDMSGRTAHRIARRLAQGEQLETVLNDYPDYRIQRLIGMRKEEPPSEWRPQLREQYGYFWWLEQAVLQAAHWRRLQYEFQLGALTSWQCMNTRIEPVTLSTILAGEHGTMALKELQQQLEQLPPYNDEELQSASATCWIHCHWEDTPMLLVQDESGSERVQFPAAWPVTPEGCADFYVHWKSTDWREARQLGAVARPYNWAVPVARVDEIGNVRWGMVDIEGRFILPCEYGYLGEPQFGWAQQIPPPANRREPWLWVEARHSPLELPQDSPLDATLLRSQARCDVIEAWSGARMNPPGYQVLAESLEYGFCVVCAENDASPVPRLGRMQAGQAPGALRWQRIGVNSDALVPAQCAETALWGYLDAKGDIAIAPQFLSAHSFNSHLAFVQTGEGWGAINESAQWILQPRWQDVDGEYDGHFFVKADQRWGVVTPHAETVVPFHNPPSDADISEWLKEAFKLRQKLRFSAWMRQARQEGHLASLGGKLHSSYGRYDYGALSTHQYPVQLRYAVTTHGWHYGAESSLVGVTLLAGTQASWNPAARNYASYIDLKTHAEITVDDLELHHPQVPWQSLALIPEPEYHPLQSAAHRQALGSLIDFLAEYLDQRYLTLDSSAAPGSDEYETQMEQLMAVRKLAQDLCFMEGMLNINGDNTEWINQAALALYQTQIKHFPPAIQGAFKQCATTAVPVNFPHAQSHAN